MTRGLPWDTQNILKNLTSDHSFKVIMFRQHLLRHQAATIVYHTHCVHLMRASSIYFHVPGKIAAHTGIRGNELADKCAKAAADKAAELTFKDSVPLSCSEVKKEIKQDIIESLQRQWDRNEQSRTLHINIMPKVSTKSVKSSSNSLVDKRLNRITTDHSNLPEHRWRTHIPDTTSPSCPCEEDIGTVEHCLLSCPLYNNQSKIMITTILSSYKDSDIPLNTRLVDVPILLRPNGDLPKTVRDAIKSLVFDYILNKSSNITI